MTDVNDIVQSIRQSKKYRDTAEETIRELAVVELGRHKRTKDVEKAVRKRLHNIMAPYLGDPDYPEVIHDLREVYQRGNDTDIKSTCAKIMAAHDSTRERLPILDTFYEQIFFVTGKPKRLLDIACGLNPLALPWMALPECEAFYAYDIHLDRVDFLNAYFEIAGLPRLARVQDVAFDPPVDAGDVALFLKEIPRFERNYEGGSRDLIEALQVRWVVASFPTVSLHGGRSLVDRYRGFFHEIVAGKGWPVTEIQFDSELVFCIDKGM